MADSTHLATLPGPAAHRRLQVGLTRGVGGRLAIDLREQHYAEGIGWFDQCGMTLDPRQFRQLQAVLGLRGTAAIEPVEVPPATLPFPCPSDPSRRRAAVGEG